MSIGLSTIPKSVRLPRTFLSFFSFFLLFRLRAKSEKYPPPSSLDSPPPLAGPFDFERFDLDDFTGCDGTESDMYPSSPRVFFRSLFLVLGVVGAAGGDTGAG